MNKRIALFILLSLFQIGTSHSQIRLPKLISDGMVLHRDAEIKIWGWAATNEKLAVEFLDVVNRTNANHCMQAENLRHK